MYTLKIISTNYVTHNVKRFVLQKPEKISYRPGQAAHISINAPEWKNQKRPFTFTSLNDWTYLEFTIKIYKDHHGVTNELSTLKPGDEIILHDIFDTFKYSGPGVFIAGGAGLTPFMAIFRALYISNNMRGVALLYSNKTARDIIYHDELTQILGPAYKNVFTRQGVIGFKERHIDRDFLIETVGDFSGRFYVCGPGDFIEDVGKALADLGARKELIVLE